MQDLKSHIITTKLTFLERKVSQRTSHRLHHFILSKLLKFQRTFHEKSFVSRFGADAPTFNTHKKHGIAVLFNCQNMLELRSKPCFKGLFEKSPLKIRKNFAQNTPIYFSEAFEVPRNFSRKVSLVRVWGGQPQLIMHAKKHGIAVLFTFNLSPIYKNQAF